MLLYGKYAGYCVKPKHVVVCRTGNGQYANIQFRTAVLHVLYIFGGNVSL